jgi:hypothetical protein
MLLGALALSLGCASFHKREIYAAYGPDGVNYYRITFKGRGSLGKVDYRSGWYDGKAVDELFGDVTSEGDLRVTTTRARQEAIAAAARDYVAAAKQGDDAKMTAAKGRIDRVTADFSTLAPADVSRDDAAMEYAGKKFVMVLAHDPDEILKMIGDSIQKDRVVEAVSRFAREHAGEASRRAEAALSQAQAHAQSLADQLGKAREGLGEASLVELRNKILYLEALTAP